jgi:ATP phosphoribosyltransferase
LIYNRFLVYAKSKMSESNKRQRASSIAEEDDLLTFAIPKKGRLYEQCIDLLKGSGLPYKRNPRLDIAFVNTTNLKLKLVFLPAADIARFVGDGNVDLGLTGQDMVAESGAEVEELLRTGFGICKLALQAPKVSKIAAPHELCGKRLATSFPNLTTKYFDKLCEQHKLPKPSIKTISGSVEAACALGLADAVVDLVETGTTMEEAGLEMIAELLQTQAVLIANKKSYQGFRSGLINTIRKRIEGYLLAKQFSMMCKLRPLPTPGPTYD